jgi:hypothetical protein
MLTMFIVLKKTGSRIISKWRYLTNNVKILKGNISKSIGYSSEDGQCMLYNSLPYMKLELSLEDKAFKWNVPVLTI